MQHAKFEVKARIAELPDEQIKMKDCDHDFAKKIGLWRKMKDNAK